MALPILDGNQTATTLATTVSGSAHYPNHIIASGTVTANAGDTSFFVSGLDVYAHRSVLYSSSGNGFSNDDGRPVDIDNPLPISGTVTIGSALFSKSTGAVSVPTQAVLLGFGYDSNQNFTGVNDQAPLPVQIYSSIPTGTNRIGVVTIGAGTVTLGASTSQIGSVTASISGTVPISISSVTVGNSITIGSCVTHGVTIANTSVTVNGTFYQATQPVSLTTLPALVAGTAQIGSVTASISNSVVTFYPMQGTSVSNTNFTSTTASTTLVSAVANREVLTVFNEGAGNLHISPGATCTTVAYQVRLSAGDYWECPQGQLSLAHTAVFSATGSTARVCQVS